ncbi:MAG TPA: S41 family peptidase [Bryobacteraceae bacterium]|nr:S41 family peptidase [Bryobacteraceae bacterium]
MKRAGGRCVAALAVFLSAAPALALTPEQRQLNIDSFEQVWKTVRDKHWQVKPAGLDWQAVHDELRPAIEKADSMDAARAVMRDMIGRLHQTHFNIVPGELYADAADESKSHDNTTGIDVRVVDSHALVTSVDTGSPAAKEGVRRGWEIVAVGGAELGPVIAQLQAANSGSTLFELLSRRAILARLEGGNGETVAVEFRDGAGRTVTKRLGYAKPRGTLTQFGYLYPSYVWFDSSRVGGGKIGYAAFNLFLDPARLMNLFGEAVTSCMHCDGFVIDLRGNPGGLGAMAMGMAGWFVDQPNQLLGTLYMRDTTLKFIVNPRARTFAGPLAILVDGASASTAEILAGGLKDLGRAQIFGSLTAAAALPSMFEKLPNGDGFQYAMANYISEGGQPLEGLGVTPDVETPLSREALLEGKDPALDAAIAWIQKK